MSAHIINMGFNNRYEKLARLLSTPYSDFNRLAHVKDGNMSKFSDYLLKFCREDSFLVINSLHFSNFNCIFLPHIQQTPPSTLLILLVHLLIMVLQITYLPHSAILTLIVLTACANASCDYTEQKSVYVSIINR